MKKTIIFLLSTSILFSSHYIFAQKDYVDRIDEFMKAEVAVNKFNGNVLVEKQGKVIYQKAFGYRNYDTQEKLDNNSMFELASVSKQFTAMSILILKEKGKLKLTDSLRKFFPELPYHNITVQHLLTHTSGLPDYMNAMVPKWDHKKIAFNNDVIKFLAAEKIPIDFKPGQKFEYSNTGYQLLASIVEKVSGQTFQDFLQQNIFKPLDMQRSRIYNTRRSTKEVIPNYAYGYTYSDSLKKYILPDVLPERDIVIFLDGIQGDGVVNSTTGDLLKWTHALKGNKLLSAATQQAMFSPQSVIDSATKFSYGYGVFMGENRHGKFISHSGGWPGYITNVVLYPKEGVTLIVLSNNESNSPAVTNTLAHIAFDKEVVMPYEHKETTSKTDSLSLQKFAGKYAVPFSGDIEVIVRDGQLHQQYPDGRSIPYKEESATKFFDTIGFDRQLNFEVDKSGKVSKAFYIQHGTMIEITKK
ncbi:MAG: serine hydrolase [Bacteroidota bacterium]